MSRLTGVVVAGALLCTAAPPARPCEPGAQRSGPGLHVRALLAADRWREALAQLRALSPERSAEPELRALHGLALLRAGRVAEAEARLVPLAAARPVPAAALLGLGRIRAAEGRDDEAAGLFREALAAAPDDADVLYWTAGAAETRAEAVRILERYLERAGDDTDPDRREGARATVRLYRALGEREVWRAVDPPRRLEIPLRPLPAVASGHRIEGYLIDASTGEDAKPLRLLLDTGSPGLFVVARALRGRGFVALAEETAFGGGGKRRHRTVRGLLPSLSVDGLEFRDALLTAGRRELDPTGRYQGVVGLAAFRGYAVTLDPDRNRLILEPPAEKPTGAPYLSFAGQMMVEARANGRPGLFLFDTGAEGSLLSIELARELEQLGVRLGGPAAIRGFGGRMQGARRARGVELEFAPGAQGTTVTLRGKTIHAVDLTLRSRLGGVEVSGFLGLDVLAERKIVIDTVRQLIQLH